MNYWISKTEAGCCPFDEQKKRWIILTMGGDATP
jgi:hypothetical protein